MVPAARGSSMAASASDNAVIGQALGIMHLEVAHMDFIRGKSFVATLEVLNHGYEAAVCCKPWDGYVGGGWLVRGAGNDVPVAMRFDYMESRQDRDHFNIRAASGEYADAKLGTSLNGYLGFYSVAEVSDLWKIEWVGSPGSGRFIWRDHRGYRVASVAGPESTGTILDHYRQQPGSTLDYLCVEKGEVLQFQAHVLKVFN